MTQHTPVFDADRIQGAIETLRGLIAAAYPEATFTVFEHDDPPGTYLRATVDVEDTDDVFAIVVDRLLDMQVEEGLPVYVSVMPPRWRIEAMHEEHMRKRAERERATAGVA